MKRFVSNDVLVLSGLLLLLALLSFRIAGQSTKSEEGDRPRRSVSSSQPGGWKALSLLLAARGVPVKKIERAPEDWPQNLHVVVTGEEYGEEWTAKEAKSALQWINGGHTLIILTGQASALLDRLNLTIDDAKLTDATLFPLQPAPFLSGVSGLNVPGAGRFSEVPADAVSLFADRSPAVVQLRYHGGTVIAVSDPAVADNRHLLKADNARFLASLIAAYRGSGAIGFDEFHQGYRAEDSLWEAIGRPGQLVFYQLLALALLIAYSSARRFGLPRPLPAPSRVSSEYVASLADLYRRARASDAALEGVYLSFRQDLCRTAGLPADAPTDEVVARAARTLIRSHGVEERLRRTMQECETKVKAGSVREQDLVPLARALEALRKEFELGGDDRGSGYRG